MNGYIFHGFFSNLGQSDSSNFKHRFSSTKNIILQNLDRFCILKFFVELNLCLIFKKKTALKITPNNLNPDSMSWDRFLFLLKIFNQDCGMN